MAYTQKVPKTDIRSLNSKTLHFDGDPAQPTGKESAVSSIIAPAMQHNLSAEIRRILWCSIPLITLLLIASYLDTKKSWVVPLAERLFHLGN